MSWVTVQFDDKGDLQCARGLWPVTRIGNVSIKRGESLESVAATLTSQKIPFRRKPLAIDVESLSLHLQFGALDGKIKDGLEDLVIGSPQ